MEAVALHLHLHPAMCGVGLAQQPAMRRQRTNVGLAAELLEHARRALDVREKKGDRAGGELAGVQTLLEATDATSN